MGRSDPEKEMGSVALEHAKSHFPTQGSLDFAGTDPSSFIALAETLPGVRRQMGWRHPACSFLALDAVWTKWPHSATTG